MQAGPSADPIAPFALKRRVFHAPHCEVWRGGADDAPVAVKLPHTEAARRCLRVERALLERVAHPGLARLVAGCPDGRWMATRWVEGPHAEAWARGRSPARVVELVAVVADTLAALHDHGAAHGDVKPANILVPASGSPVLIDPGIGAVQGPGFYGTPGYAAPEQLAGRPASAATDAYGLGVTLFKLLTGTLPFTSTPQAQALVPLRRLPWTPAMVRPPMPAALCRLLFRLLHRDPDRRPSDLRALAHRLRGAAVSAPRVWHPAVFAAWRDVGAWFVRAQDEGSGGLLVLHGPDNAPADELIEALELAAGVEGVRGHGPGPGADPRPGPHLVVLDGADAAAQALALWRRHRARVLLRTTRPIANLAEAGAAHVAVLPRSGPDSVAERQRRIGTVGARALLDALADGARSIDALAGALGVGALELLERAEPLIEAGLLEETRDGRALARVGVAGPPR